jgi:hypothetical protein
MFLGNNFGMDGKTTDKGATVCRDEKQATCPVASPEEAILCEQLDWKEGASERRLE